ncbi:putative transposase [Pseudomonas syringae pv. philadelphi]|uniref:Putative transposase n=1 Tax=Pseudomonas syringae pv. philadelphi TaxID=251706 RepID=A0A3M3Z2D5_9PSED|nr:putative transposase [Pseudomonas syringae pv. philadelphi]
MRLQSQKSTALQPAFIPLPVWLSIARSTLAQWVGNCGVQLQPLVDALREAVLTHGVVHADETPVQMLTPSAKKTHRAYVWAYATSQFSELAAVVYDFSPSRAGEHARNFLGHWNGKLVCDDFAGYKAGLNWALRKSAAWPMRAASSSICTRPTRARSLKKHCTT